MKTLIELNIQEAEGIPEGDYGFYVTVDGRLYDVLTNYPYFCSELPQQGELRVLLKDMKTDNVAGSVSFEIQNLCGQGTKWLPLSKDVENDYYLDIEPHLNNPRIMIELGVTECLSPVPEALEDNSSFLEPSFMGKSQEKINTTFENYQSSLQCTSQSLNNKNKALREKIIQLEQKIQNMDWAKQKEIHHIVHSHHEEQSQFAIMLEKHKFQFSQLKTIKDDLEKQAKSMESLYKQEKLSREHLEKQINKITHEFEMYISSTEQKETQYKTEFSQKDLMIQNLQSKINELTNNLRSLEQDKKTLQSQALISSTQKQQVEDLHEKLSKALDSLEESEFQRKMLHRQLEDLTAQHDQELTSSLRNRHSETNKELENVVEKLNKQLQEAHQKSAQLENQLEDKELELVTKASGVQNDYSSQIKTLKKKLEDKTNAFNQLKQEHQNLNLKLTQSQKESQSLSQANQQLNEKMDKYQKQCTELGLKLKEKLEENPKLQSQNADERFHEYLKNYGVEDKFVRVAEGVYTFGSKKVSVSIKNGCLVCRVGGGYMMVDQFIKLFIIQGLKVEEDEHKKFRKEETPNKHKRTSTVGVLFEEFRTEATEQDLEFEPKENETSKVTPTKLRVPKTTIKAVRNSSMSKLSRDKSFTPVRQYTRRSLSNINGKLI